MKPNPEVENWTVSCDCVERLEGEEMSRAFFHHHTHTRICTPSLLPTSHPISSTRIQPTTIKRPSAPLGLNRHRPPSTVVTAPRFATVTASLSPLDLTEDNIRQVLTDARVEASKENRHFDLFLSPRASVWSEIHICAFFFFWFAAGADLRWFRRNNRKSGASWIGWTVCEDQSERSVLARTFDGVGQNCKLPETKNSGELCIKFQFDGFQVK